MKTEILIIGGGPSGLLLSQLLNLAGVETVILERTSRERVLARIRAGVLESGSVKMLQKAGVDKRLKTEGSLHQGCYLSDDDLMVRINFFELTGKEVTIFGQSEVTADLYAAQDEMGTRIFHNVEDVTIQDLDQSQSSVQYSSNGARHTVKCAYIVGCDGFHGVSRKTIPEQHRQEFERVYPFGWLGLLSHTPPVNHELLYANSQRGFALASMRNDNLSRYYIQVPLTDRVDQWSDEKFWTELKKRLPNEIAADLQTGESIEKSIAPLRSFVTEPLRWGNLFLVGDAAHIVPPTGAKGLNLAISDVFYLHEALIQAVKKGKKSGLDDYSQKALQRIWKTIRFSWQMTNLLHQFDGEDRFAAQMRKASLLHLSQSETARRDLAENYIGLPY